MIGYIIDFIGLLLVVRYANKNVEKAVKFLIIICFFQNFILCIFSPYMTKESFSLFIILKELFVLLYITIRLIKNNFVIKKFQLFCCFSVFLLIILAFLGGDGLIKTRLSCMRQLYLPFVFYLFGSLSDVSVVEIKRIVKFYISLCIITTLFGFVENSMGSELWENLNIVSYCENKGIISTEGFYNGLPGNFYSFDIPFLLHAQRMASFFLDPVICGQVLSFAFVASFFGKSIILSDLKRYMYSFILGIGICMTLCKGGMIIAMFSFCILVGKIFEKKIISNIMLLIGAGVVFLYISFSLTNELSTATHMNGLVSGIQSMFENPFGMGIGSAGNLSVEEGKNINIIGAESYVGSMLAQIGIIGLMINMYYFVYIKNIVDKIEVDRNIRAIIAVPSFALALTSLVNFTAISFTSCFIFIILISMLNSTKENGMV